MFGVTNCEIQICGRCTHYIIETPMGDGTPSFGRTDCNPHRERACGADTCQRSGQYDRGHPQVAEQSSATSH